MNESEQLEQAIAALEAQRSGLGDAVVDAAQAPLREKLAALTGGESAAEGDERTALIAASERRIVTVLFCDVTGSTAMAETLDPEVWTDIMNEAFEQLIEAVERFEGTVAQLTGDGLLAIFGAPVAHEDDPERAVLAGLSMLANIEPLRERLSREQGLDFNIRVGINTGLVVVGDVGSDKYQEFTAMGDTVNLAARMEGAAQPGTVQISGSTYRRVAPLFDVEALGSVTVKGKREPVPAYHVLRKKAAPGRLRGIAGLDAPMVGRDAEMHALRGAIIRLRQGEGKIVSVIGDAGLGKSRLLAELHAAPTPLPEVKSPVRWLEGRSLSYESAAPYAPIVRLLSSYFALGDGRTDEAHPTDGEKLEAIKAKLDRFMPDLTPMVAPYLAALLSIGLTGEDAERVRYLSPPQMRARTSQAVLAFIEQLAAQQPLVLIVDDLHWSDSASLDLLQELLPLTERTALLIVTLFRPDKEAPSWPYHEGTAEAFGERYLAIELNPLADDASREIAANLLRVEDLPDMARNLIMARAEGNPFFVEEIIRTLLDADMLTWEDESWQMAQEVENFAVPDTLAGVITARIDRLDEKTKHLVQAAAVIGRQFDLGTLAAIFETPQALEPALANLQERDLINETSQTPYRLFQFKHALLQETVYASLLLSSRRALHLQVAEHYEEMGSVTGVTGANYSGDIVQQWSGETARHFLGAQEEARALPYLVEAGDWVAGAYAAPEASAYYRQALAILDNLKEYQLEVAQRAYEGLGSILTSTGAIAAAQGNHEAMLALAHEADYAPMEVSALNKLAFIAATFHGELAEAEALLAKSERVARQYNYLAGLAELHTIQCGVCLATGDFDGAVDHFDQSADLGEKLDLEEPLLFGITHTATTLMSMTHYEEGWKKAQEARQMAERLGNRKYLAEVLTQPFVDYYVSQGNLVAARKSAEEGLEIGTPIGATVAEFQGHLQLAQIARWQGDYEEVLAHLNYLDHKSNTFPAPGFRLLPLAILSSTTLEISEALLKRSLAYQAEALKILNSGATIGFDSLAWKELALSRLLVGDLELAGDYLNKGLAARDSFMYSVRPSLLAGQARLALARSDLQEAAQRMAEARSFVEERGMGSYRPLIALVEGQIAAAAGNSEKALDKFARATAAAREMGMLPTVWQAQAAAARELDADGRTAEADEKRCEAEAVIDEIAAKISDDDLAAAFSRSARDNVG